MGVICGHRRLKAAMECHHTEIPAIIRRDLAFGNPEHVREIDTIQIEENLQRKDLTPIQEAMALRNFKEKYKLNNVQMAKNLGIPRPTLVETLKIAALGDLIMGDVERLTPPPDEAEHQKLISILAECLKDNSARSVLAFIRKKKAKSLRKGPDQPINSMAKSFSKKALELISKIRVDPVLVKALEGRGIEKLQTHLSTLNNEALAMTLPGTTFRCQVSISMGEKDPPLVSGPQTQSKE